MPLLDNGILADLNEQQFEIDHFLTPVPSNESEIIPDFISISQNCSFDSISVESSNGSQIIEQLHHSSASSSTSEIYSPIQITPPETPPSCETSQNCQLTNATVNSNLNKVKRTSNRSKKSRNETSDCNKKKKLLPLAPKTDTITVIQLNNNGVLDHQKQIIQQFNQQNTLASLTNQVSANDLLNNNNSVNYNLNNANEQLSKEELSKVKEKARRLRNRQSAMISRQKKVEYVKGIEKRLEELNDENVNLKKENRSLKDLVSKLTFENNQLKNVQNKMQSLTNDYLKYPLQNSPTTKQGNFLFNSNDTNKAKKTISLLAVIFLIGLNMNLYNDNFKTYESTKKLSLNKQTESSVFKGRVLLWSDNLESMSSLNSSINATTVNCNNQKLISQNETLILESKLRNWAIHQTTKQQFYSSGKNFNSNFANKFDDSSNERKLPWYLGIRNWNHVDENKERKFYSTENEQMNYEQIINLVKERAKEDTYYFLSLNPSDHLILPLNFYSNASKNGLYRPKFSLLIPTLNSQFSANFTQSRNSTKEFKNSSSFLQLIEIDFEVINMKPIQILKNRLRLHPNQRFINRRIVRNTFDKQPHSNSTTTTTKPLKPILLRNQTTIVQSQQINKTIANSTDDIGT